MYEDRLVHGLQITSPISKFLYARDVSRENKVIKNILSGDDGEL